MEREKIRKFYQKLGIMLNDETLKTILKDKERAKSPIRLYKQEEINQMNLMFNKEIGNEIFTKEELEYANQFDLFDEHVGKVAGIIWKYKNNKKALKQIQDILEEKEINDFDNILGGVLNVCN